MDSSGASAAGTVDTEYHPEGTHKMNCTDPCKETMGYQNTKTDDQKRQYYNENLFFHVYISPLIL